MTGRWFATLVAAITTAAGAAWAQPASVPILQAEMVEAPKIDGVLDDACWQGREKLSGFKVSANGSDPNQPTEVMICRDAGTLYVAFICHDSQPSLIHASQTQRGGSIGSDDFVSVLIDALHTHLQHYHFEVTAGGVQYEEIPNNAASNITWRGDWQAAARRNDTGWTAEVAIPFAMLRYPGRADTIGIVFRRYIPRVEEMSYWPDVGPTEDMALYADLTGLDLPARRSRPIFMPYTVSSRADDGSFTQIGFDYKEELPNSLVAMMTYNPDFADIQDAVTSIDYSYTERRTAEPRPFFYEGCNMFIDDEAYCSRRIGDIDCGVKTFGKVGKQSYTFLDAFKRGEGNHFTSSYGYDFDRDTNLVVSMNGSTLSNASATEPDSSTCLATGGMKRWRGASGTTTFSFRRFNAINSSGTPDGNMFKASLGKSEAAGNFGYNFYYEDIDPTFYVRDGYVPLIGVRGFATEQRFHDNPSKGSLTYWAMYARQKRYWAPSGGLHHESVEFGGSCDTRAEWQYGFWFGEGSWLGARDSTRNVQIAWLSRHLYGGGSAGYTIGKRAGQDYTYLTCDQVLQVGRRLILNCLYERTKLAGVTDSQFTLAPNYQISPEQSLGAWVVGRGSDTNLCCTFRQTVRSGSDIFFIYGYPNTDTTASRFAIKIVRPVEW